MPNNSTTETTRSIPANRRPLIIDYAYPSDSSRSPQSIAPQDYTSNESRGQDRSLSAPATSLDMPGQPLIKKTKIEGHHHHSPSSKHSATNSSRIDVRNGSDVLKNFKNQASREVRQSTQTDLSIPVHNSVDQNEYKNSNQCDEKSPQVVTDQNKEAAKLKLELDSLTKRNVELESNTLAMSTEIKRNETQLKKSLSITKKLLIEKSELEKKRAQMRCAENNIKLGQYSMQRYGSSYKEVWQTGSKVRNLKKRQKQIVQEREELEKQKKHLTKCKATLNSSIQSLINSQSCNSNNGGSSTSNSCQSASLMNDLVAYNAENRKLMEICELEEILKLKQFSLRKEDNENNLDIERAERERLMHAREIKRLENQENSRFNGYQVLNNRYLILCLIGKGGFSEVHKAFDMQEQRYVACKIHQLNREWKEERKVNYIRHAVREYEIHKKLSHPRIVMLYDVFEIDNNTFCTVLEYCGGPDLDFQLKQNFTLPEREARAIICQVLSALKYLNEMSNPIIHYDLKPANILLLFKENYRDLANGFMNSKDTVVKSSNETDQNSNDEFPPGACLGKFLANHDDEPIVSPLDIKITDFGLSKVCERQDDSGSAVIDLTSQGAGTYWYLPPETFSTGIAPPKISSKVDVWSVGIIFYQMLYGQKPFAHNMSQTAIIEQNAIQKQASSDLKFPAKPQVSQEAKNFIKQCLIYDVNYRPDVMTLVSHEYLRPVTYKAKSLPSDTSFTQ